MIVQRISVKVKTGFRDAVLESLKASRAELEDPSSMRILTTNTGAPHHTVVYELTDESVEGIEKGWEEWMSRPEYQSESEKWMQIVDDWSDVYLNIEE